MCAFEINISEVEEYEGAMLSPEVKEVDVVLLWDQKHRAWWRRDGRGYTDDVNKAGRFSRRVAGRLYDPTRTRVYQIPARVAYGIVATTLNRVQAQIATSARNADARIEGVGNP